MLVLMAQSIPSWPIPHPQGIVCLFVKWCFPTMGFLSSKVYPMAYEKNRNTNLLKKDLVAQNFEFTFCFVPRVWHVNAFSGPHRRAFAASRWKNDECPTNAGEMGTLGIDWACMVGNITISSSLSKREVSSTSSYVEEIFLASLLCAGNYSYIIIFKDSSLLLRSYRFMFLTCGFFSQSEETRKPLCCRVSYYLKTQQFGCV